MSFSPYKIIILNNEIEKNEERDDDRINKKNINFKRLCDFEIIFIKVYNLKVCNSFLLLNESKSSKSLRRVNNFDF